LDKPAEEDVGRKADPVKMTTSTSSRIDQADQLRHALAFVRRGHAVLPLHWPIKVNGRVVCSCKKAADCPTPAKHPYGRLVPNGLLSASTDEAVIRKWFADTPQANLGVRTETWITLDIDPRHNGDRSLAALERDHDFPPTWRALTGGGGEHIIFAAPADAEIGSTRASDQPLLGPGIDIRARDGYIVAPPSRHLSGRIYAWSVDHHPAETPLAVAPAWLVEALSAGKQPGSVARHDAAQWAIDKAGLVTEYRDMAVASVAGKLLRAISLDPAFVAILVQDWNARHCSPPLPESAVADIIDSITRREIARLENSNG
jgi:Bifunctional DNA primase/polymerase, N-terminal/Primase C terminal 1 (PriCT-1)